jgi:hypothetical protein
MSIIDGMTPEDKLVYSKLVFFKVKEDDLRLQRGVALRKEMWGTLKEGKIPTTGYRYEWMVRSSQVLIGTLRNIAYAFNLQHGDDKASVSDMVDILKHAIWLLQKKKD